LILAAADQPTSWLDLASLTITLLFILAMFWLFLGRD
jgi:hypothetical protein